MYRIGDPLHAAIFLVPDSDKCETDEGIRLLKVLKIPDKYVGYEPVMQASYAGMIGEHLKVWGDDEDIAACKTVIFEMHRESEKIDISLEKLGANKLASYDTYGLPDGKAVAFELVAKLKTFDVYVLVGIKDVLAEIVGDAGFKLESKYLLGEQEKEETDEPYIELLFKDIEGGCKGLISTNEVMILSANSSAYLIDKVDVDSTGYEPNIRKVLEMDIKDREPAGYNESETMVIGREEPIYGDKAISLLESLGFDDIAEHASEGLHIVKTSTEQGIYSLGYRESNLHFNESWLDISIKKKFKDVVERQFLTRAEYLKDLTDSSEEDD